MTVDILAVLLVLLAAYLGWRKGAVSQVGRIAAALLAVLGASFLAAPVREIFFSKSAWSQPAIEAASLVLAGVVIYASVALTGWLIVRAMRMISEHLSRLDRLGGASLGLVKGLLLIYFLLTAMVLMEASTQRVDPANSLKLRGGAATSFVEEHNILAPWQLPTLDQLHGALKVRYYAEKLGRAGVLREHALANDFLRREMISSLSEDPALMQAVLGDRFAFTLADPRVREILGDEESTAILGAVDWSKILKEIQSPVII